MSVDPLGSKAPGWSPFNYAFNNPYSYVDPDGKFPFLIVAIIALAITYDVANAPATVEDQENAEESMSIGEAAFELGDNVSDIMSLGAKPLLVAGIKKAVSEGAEHYLKKKLRINLKG